MLARTSPNSMPPSEHSRPEDQAVTIGVAASAHHFERLFTLSVDLAAVAGFDGYFKLVNPAFENTLGYTARELTSRPYMDFVHPDDRDMSAREAKVVEGGIIAKEFENRYICKDGSICWLSWRVVPVLSEQLVYAVAHDITQRKNNEARIREIEERFQVLVGSVTEYGIFMLDPMGHIITWNAGAQRISGYAPAEIIGRHFSVFYTQQDRESDKPLRELEIAHATGLYKEEGWRVRKDGSQYYASVTITALRNAEGNLVGYAKVSKDVTERMEAEREIRKKNEQLEVSIDSERHALQALRQAQGRLVQSEKLAALGQLVAGVAHEINNPLAFVINNMAVLKRDIGLLRQLLDKYAGSDPILAAHAVALSDEINAFTQRIDLACTTDEVDSLLQRSSEGLRRIQQIVKDLRDFARQDAVGDLQDNADINAGVRSTVNIVRGQANKHHTTLEENLGPLPPVTCQPARINQVVLNLVVNAIQACPPESGKIVISTRQDGDWVEIQVSDNGTGIARANLGRIFDPFFTTKPQGQGTGLGLSISHGIVSDHGGTISVDSEVGRGTTFTVRIPIQPRRPERSES